MNSSNFLILLSCIIISSAIVCYGADNNNYDDEKCKNDFHSFVSCLKEQDQHKSESEKAAAKKALEQKVDTCFAQSGCPGPDWTAVDESSSTGKQKPKGGAFGGGGGAYEMPASVKECVKRKVTAKINQKVNECLSKRGIKNVNLTEFAYEHDGSAQLDQHHPANNGSGGKGGIQMMMKAKFNVVKAVDKCCQQKGGDTNSVKPLEQCLQNVKHDERPQMCAKVKPCQDKVSKPCQKRGEDVREALCLCKKEKESDTSNKMRALAQSQKTVSMGDLMKTMADQQDMNEILTDVENCYAENHESEPIALKLFKMMSSGGFQGRAGNGGFGGAGGGGGPGSVNASTVIIMSDMLQLDAQDQTECKPCQ